MPTQTDVQKLIQSLVPSGVNNGNPNTAYNSAPTMDSAGNWFGPNLPSAASVNGLTRAAQAMPNNWTAPENTLPDISLPGLPELGPWTPPDSWVSPVTPPVTQRPPTDVPARPANSPPGRRVEQGSLQPGQGSFLGKGYNPGLAKAGSAGWGRATAGPGVDLSGLGGATWGAANLGMNSPSTHAALMDYLAGSGGGIAGLFQGADPSSMGGFLEALDKLSEPFVSGDFVQNGNFNMRMLPETIAKMLLPDGLVNLATNLIGGSKYDAWLAKGYGEAPGSRLFGSEAMGNTRGYGIGQINPLTGKTNFGLGMGNGGIFSPNNNTNLINASLGTDTSNPAVQQALVELAFGAGSTTGSSRSAPTKGEIAGAGQVTGPAARAMFEAMQKADMHKAFQTGGGASIFGGNGTYKK